MPPEVEVPDVAEIVVETDLDATEAWLAVTDWVTHARLIPFTTMTLDLRSTAPGLGDVLTATTRLGPLHVVDTMQVTHWQPPHDRLPGLAVLTKTGDQVIGGASVEVEPLGARALVRWREDARPGPGFPGGMLVRRIPARVRGPVTNWAFGTALRRLLADAEARDLSARDQRGER